MPVETLFEDPRWEPFGLASLAEAAARATLGCIGLDPGRFNVSLVGCNDERIAALNAAFRGKAAPTNVLSWPSEDLAPEVPGAVPRPPDPEREAELGDIALAWETCAAEAAAADIPMTDHVSHLIVHGTLHLLGYDHMTEQDAARMENLEREILATLGVADPY